MGCPRRLAARGGDAHLDPFSLKRKLRARRLMTIAAWVASITGLTIEVTIQVPNMEVHMAAPVDLHLHGKAGADVIPGGVADPRER